MKKIICFLLLLISIEIQAAPTTVGLISHRAGSLDDGYILFAPNNGTHTYLIDKCGYVINRWNSKYRPGFAALITPEGSLLRTAHLDTSAFKAGGTGGLIEKYSWDGKLEWKFKLSNNKYSFHHDIELMPNGNILAICWEKINKYEAMNLGRKEEFCIEDIWNEKIIELKPIGTDSAEIVWEWSAWDHLIQDADKTKPLYGVVSNHPEKIDLNFVHDKSKIDWLHFNSVDYNEKLDQILISVNYFSEAWVIDHSTTSKQAKEHSGGKYGKGGDLLYRWGNPETYKMGTISDRKLFNQHDAQWIPDTYPYGNCISIFNNERVIDAVPASSVDIFKPSVDDEGNYSSNLPYGPKDVSWSYSAKNPQDFYAANISSAQMLENGNMLVCSGVMGVLFEVDSSKKEVWYYVNPVSFFGILKQGDSPKLTNQVFRCRYYPTNYSGFLGKEIARQGLIEDENFESEDCQLNPSIIIEQNSKLVYFINQNKKEIVISDNVKIVDISIFNLNGEKINTILASNIVNTECLTSGFYILKASDIQGNIYFDKFFVVR